MGVSLHGDINAILETGRNFGLELDEELRFVNFGDRDAWWWRNGLVVLRRWTGRRTPPPRLAPVVGYAERPATAVGTHAGVSSGGDHVYWLLPEQIGRGGIAARSRTRLIRAVVYQGGSWVGALPNTPGLLALRQTTGLRVVATWVYNPLGQQAEPATFEVFSNGGSGTVDLSSSVGTVPYEPGRRHYRWISGAFNAGDEVAIVVRARSAAGVYSLIGEHGDAYRGPGGSFQAIDASLVPRLRIVQRTLTAPGAVWVA